MSTARPFWGRAQRALQARLTPIAIVLFPAQFFLGLGWVRAGVEKMIDGAWWDGTALTTWLADQERVCLPFMHGVAGNVFEPLAVPVSLVVMFTEPLIGLALVFGQRLRLALLWGIVLNLVFVLMGAVTPAVFYLVIQLALLTAVDLGLLGEAPRQPRPVVAGAWAVLGLVAAPFVTTLEPADVIHDPGIMIATFAFIAAATEGLLVLARRLAPSDEGSADDGPGPVALAA